jgi:HK97 family phage prohead protease
VSTVHPNQGRFWQELDQQPAPGAIWAAAPVTGVDEGRRTIAGLVVPWDIPARVNGAEFPLRFVRGSILVDQGARLLAHHDRARPLGAPLEWKDTPAGLRALFKVARTRDGDEALSMASDGILDGLSIGAELVDVDELAGEIAVRAALAREVSLVTLPAWALARVGS